MTPKLFVFVPAFRNQMTASTMLTTHALSQACMVRGVGFTIASMSWPDIGDLRGMAVTYFYDLLKEATHLLFIDDDMAFPPELVLDMLMFNQPVVGAMYPKRTLPLEFAGSGPKDAQSMGGFLKVDGVGMGVTLIRRDAIDIMLQKMPEIVDVDVSGIERVFGTKIDRLIRAFEPVRTPRGKMSEDFSFCQRWRDCGGEVWAACHHPIKHIGDYAYEGCFRDWSIQRAAEEATQQAAE
jgi:hypothetical protein